MKTKLNMLATDLDHTLVGLEIELKELMDFFDHTLPSIALVYVTGRHADSVKELMRDAHLPIPDLVISDVGTKIWHMPDWVEDALWREQTLADWQPKSIQEAAKQFPKMVQQDLPDQRRISFTLHDDVETVQAFEKSLNDAGISHRLIYSSSSDVDVLPMCAGKGNALEYVLRTYTAENVNLLVAGDSENDLDMLNRGWPSVIVGNAQASLKVLPAKPNLFKAERHCAGGIYDAWHHFYGT